MSGRTCLRKTGNPGKKGSWYFWSKKEVGGRETMRRSISFLNFLLQSDVYLFFCYYLRRFGCNYFD